MNSAVRFLFLSFSMDGFVCLFDHFELDGFGLTVRFRQSCPVYFLCTGYCEDVDEFDRG